MSRPAPGRRSAYAVFSEHGTRWRDNDMYGHLNNVVHYEIFDAAVNGWLIRAEVLDPPHGPYRGLVVESGCRYHAELRYPGPVTAGLRVARIGGSSVCYEIGLFADGADVAAAEGFFIHVYVDAQTGRPMQIPGGFRAVLEGALRAE